MAAIRTIQKLHRAEVLVRYTELKFLGLHSIVKWTLEGDLPTPCLRNNMPAEGVVIEFAKSLYTTVLERKSVPNDLMGDYLTIEAMVVITEFRGGHPRYFVDDTPAFFFTRSFCRSTGRGVADGVYSITKQDALELHLAEVNEGASLGMTVMSGPGSPSYTMLMEARRKSREFLRDDRIYARRR